MSEIKKGQIWKNKRTGRKVFVYNQNKWGYVHIVYSDWDDTYISEIEFRRIFEFTDRLIDLSKIMGEESV